MWRLWRNENGEMKAKNGICVAKDKQANGVAVA
jgi:hypothetical protein